MVFAGYCTLRLQRQGPALAQHSGEYLLMLLRSRLLPLQRHQPMLFREERHLALLALLGRLLQKLLQIAVEPLFGLRGVSGEVCELPLDKVMHNHAKYPMWALWELGEHAGDDSGTCSFARCAS